LTPHSGFSRQQAGVKFSSDESISESAYSHDTETETSSDSDDSFSSELKETVDEMKSPTTPSKITIDKLTRNLSVAVHTKLKLDANKMTRTQTLKQQQNAGGKQTSWFVKSIKQPEK